MIVVQGSHCVITRKENLCSRPRLTNLLLSTNEGRTRRRRRIWERSSCVCSVIKLKLRGVRRSHNCSSSRVSSGNQRAQFCARICKCRGKGLADSTHFYLRPTK